MVEGYGNIKKSNSSFDPFVGVLTCTLSFSFFSFFLRVYFIRRLIRRLVARIFPEERGRNCAVRLLFRCSIKLSLGKIRHPGRSFEEIATERKRGASGTLRARVELFSSFADDATRGENSLLKSFHNLQPYIMSIFAAGFNAIYTLRIVRSRRSCDVVGGTLR